MDIQTVIVALASLLGALIGGFTNNALVKFRFDNLERQMTDVLDTLGDIKNRTAVNENEIKDVERRVRVLEGR